MYEENKKRGSGKFKWFITILIFIAFLIIVSVIQDGNKTEFEVCYDKCTRLGKSPGEDGRCAPGYFLRSNWCIEHGRDGECLKMCK